ncbi:MAG: hypothetical protein J5762_05290 [Clostridia bacterium]|nr:hypothetical protein [Clostridia bacterium]
MDEINPRLINEVDDKPLLKRKKKGLPLFIASAIVFAIVFVLDVFFIFFLSAMLVDINSHTNSLGEALGLVFGLILLIGLWVVLCPVPSIISIVLEILSIRYFKVQSIVMLSVTSAVFIANVVLFLVFVFSGNSSSSAMLL